MTATYYDLCNLANRRDPKAVEILAQLYSDCLRCKDEDIPLTKENFAGVFDDDPLCQHAWKVREDFLTEVYSKASFIW